MGRPQRRITIINGKSKYRSHVVWHAHTGHWPEWPEVIHHIDDDTMNDDFNNLQLMSNSEHSFLHNRGERNSMFGRHRFGEEHPNWKGDAATDHAKKCRIYRARRRAER